MDSLPSPVFLLAGLALLGLAPFLAVLASAYLKIVVVLYILRNALGLPQVPPNLAVNGLAIILTLFIMAPVGQQAIDNFRASGVRLDDFRDPGYPAALRSAAQPLREFLERHSDRAERHFFTTATTRLWPPDQAARVREDHFFVLLPSFLVSQLKSAFEVGFLLYLPFVVIDIIVSNVLLAMGMIMVSPIMISLPFKILLFVMVDGWARLIHGLVLSYQ